MILVSVGIHPPPPFYAQEKEAERDTVTQAHC